MHERGILGLDSGGFKFDGDGFLGGVWSCSYCGMLMTAEEGLCIRCWGWTEVAGL